MPSAVSLRKGGGLICGMAIYVNFVIIRNTDIILRDNKQRKAFNSNDHVLIFNK